MESAAFLDRTLRDALDDFALPPAEFSAVAGWPGGEIEGWLDVSLLSAEIPVCLKVILILMAVPGGLEQALAYTIGRQGISDGDWADVTDRVIEARERSAERSRSNLG